MEQAEARAGGAHGNKGWDAALAALEMADLFDRLDARGRGLRRAARARALQALYAWDMRGHGSAELERVATQVWDDLAITPEERADRRAASCASSPRNGRAHRRGARRRHHQLAARAARRDRALRAAPGGRRAARIGETPPRVVIQEAVRLAERFGSAAEREVRERRARRARAAHGAHLVRLLLVNWQDRENPARRRRRDPPARDLRTPRRARARGHAAVRRLARLPARAPRSTGSTCIASARGTPSRSSRSAPTGGDLAGAAVRRAVEDINKIPLYTPRWGATATSSRSCRTSSAATAFQELRRAAGRRRLARRAAARPRLPRRARSRRSARARRTISPRAASRASRSTVIYPGIDTDGTTPPIRRRARPTPVFAYLGRLKKYKGVHLVIRAFAALGHPDARRSRSPARATIAPRSSASRASLDLGERVRFLGRISETEKLALLRRAWALVFASPKEGWGITNLEAAACGTPVVASNSPGHPRVGARRRDRLSRAARRRRARWPPRWRRLARIARLVAAAGRAARALRRDVHLGARRRRDGARTCTRVHHLQPGADDSHPDASARCSTSCGALLELERVPGTGGLERLVPRRRRVEPGARARRLRRALRGRAHPGVRRDGDHAISARSTPRRAARTSRQFFALPDPLRVRHQGAGAAGEVLEEAIARRRRRSCARALKTNEFYNRIKPWLEDEFAPHDDAARLARRRVRRRPAVHRRRAASASRSACSTSSSAATGSSPTTS